MHTSENSERQPLDLGGNYFLSMTSLSTGIGILKEKYAPYTDSEGKLDKEGTGACRKISATASAMN